MKKIKLLPSVLMLALCIGILGIGIYAATPTNNVITGTITVNAANAGIKVEVWEGESVGAGAPFKTATGRTQTEIDLQNIAIDASNALSLEDVPIKYYTIRFSTTSNLKFVVDTETIQLVNGTVTETSATKEGAIIITKNHKKYLEDGTTGLAYFTADTKDGETITADNSYVITIAIKLGELPEQAFGAEFDMVFDVYKLEDWVEEGNTGINGIDYLHLGEFPQSLAAEFNSVEDIEGYTATPDLFYGYSETDGKKEARVVYTKDGETDGSRYVCLTSIYEQNSGETKNAANLYKIEPLKWRILNKEVDGTTKLMCDTMVEQVYFQQFYTEYYYDPTDCDGNKLKEAGREMTWLNNYNVSTLRNYLIDTFYNGAFSASEQSVIKAGVVDNSTLSHGTNSTELYSCFNTNDKVFAPSVAEVTNSTYGFDTDETSSDDTRKVTASDYATATGIVSNNGVTKWLLRTPHTYYVGVRIVTSNGAVDIGNAYYHADDGYGCVPAMVIGL